MHAIILDSFGVYADDQAALTTLMSGIDCHTGKHLADLLGWPHHPHTYVAAVAAGRPVTTDDIDVGGNADDGIAEFAWNRTDLPAIATALARIDAADAEPEIIWHDDGGHSFAYNGSLLETLRLTRAVAFYRINRGDHTNIDVAYLFSLPPGGYTVAWSGRYRLRLADIGYTAGNPLGFYDAAEILACRTATAFCDTCATVWTAEDGSATFAPETRSSTWRIGDTDPSDDNTVTCPATTCGGHVAFTITT